jgi:hypothetical protein
MARKFFSIQTCEFTYQCPRTWESLAPTETHSERQCEACQRTVHLCEDDATLTRHIQAGHCVAVEDKSRGELLVGEVSPAGSPQVLEEPPGPERQWLKIAPPIYDTRVDPNGKIDWD